MSLVGIRERPNETGGVGAMSALSSIERKALETLAGCDTDFAYLSFAGVERRSGLKSHLVRPAVKGLAAKGLAQFGNGLFDEDGRVAGSGYRATEAGKALATAHRGSALDRLRLAEAALQSIEDVHIITDDPTDALNKIMRIVGAARYPDEQVGTLADATPKSLSPR